MRTAAPWTSLLISVCKPLVKAVVVCMAAHAVVNRLQHTQTALAHPTLPAPSQTPCPQHSHMTLPPPTQPTYASVESVGPAGQQPSGSGTESSESAARSADRMDASCINPRHTAEPSLSLLCRVSWAAAGGGTGGGATAFAVRSIARTNCAARNKGMRAPLRAHSRSAAAAERDGDGTVNNTTRGNDQTVGRASTLQRHGSGTTQEGVCT